MVGLPMKEASKIHPRVSLCWHPGDCCRHGLGVGRRRAISRSNRVCNCSWQHWHPVPWLHARPVFRWAAHQLPCTHFSSTLMAEPQGAGSLRGRQGGGEMGMTTADIARANHLRRFSPCGPQITLHETLCAVELLPVRAAHALGMPTAFGTAWMRPQRQGSLWHGEPRSVPSGSHSYMQGA